MDEPFYSKARKSPSTSDDLHVYKAVIYKNLGPNDDRLQVRIIPNMLGISKDESDLALESNSTISIPITVTARQSVENKTGSGS